MSSRAQQLPQRVAQAWNEGKVEIVDEVFAPNYASHPLWPNPVPFGPTDASDRDQIKHSIKAFREQFPDLDVTLDETLEAGDKVVTRWTFRGTERNGKKVSWTSIVISRLAGGRVVEDWFLWDRLGFWQQLGIVPETRELQAKERE